MARDYNRRDFLRTASGVLVAGSLFGLAGRVFGGETQNQYMQENWRRGKEFLDHIRKEHGLAPIEGFHPILNEASRLAVKCLNGNKKHFKNREHHHILDKDLPLYTEEGAWAARTGYIDPGSGDPYMTIHYFLKGPFHTPDLLDPRLKWCGLYGENGVTVLCFDKTHSALSKEREKLKEDFVVVDTPAANSVRNDTTIADEYPDPRPYDTGDAGRHISSIVYSDKRFVVKNIIEASLVDQKGNIYRPTEGYLPAREITDMDVMVRALGNQVTLITREPLKPNMTYKPSIKFEVVWYEEDEMGKLQSRSKTFDRVWKFSTGEEVFQGRIPTPKDCRIIRGEE
jgi:hypothetical protein